MTTRTQTRYRRPAWMGRPFALVALLSLLAACQSARMPLPDELSGGETWPVQGRQGWKLQERLHFGPYAAENVDRSWTRGRDLEVMIYERNRRKQTYSFTLAEQGSAVWHADCSTSLDRRTVHTSDVDLEFEDRSRLDCELAEAGGSARWLLVLGERYADPLEGRLYEDLGGITDGTAGSRGPTGTHRGADIGPSSFQVRGTKALDGGLPSGTTSGYLIESGTGAVAAVEVVNNGSVTLRPTLDPAQRSLLSAAAAALLLLEELRSVLDDES